MPPLSARAKPLAVLCLFVALAIAWSWPLVRHLATRIPHDPGDPVLNTYLIWWNAATLPFAAAWYTNDATMTAFLRMSSSWMRS